MDALAREDRIWAAQAAVGQDLDVLTELIVAKVVAGQSAAWVAAANKIAIFLESLVGRIADSDVDISEISFIFSDRPFSQFDKVDVRPWMSNLYELGLIDRRQFDLVNDLTVKLMT